MENETSKAGDNKDLFAERGFQDPALSTGEQDIPLEKLPSLDTSIVSERTGGTFSALTQEPVTSKAGEESELKPCDMCILELESAHKRIAELEKENRGLSAVIRACSDKPLPEHSQLIWDLNEKIADLEKRNRELEKGKKILVRHSKSMFKQIIKLESKLKTVEDALGNAHMGCDTRIKLLEEKLAAVTRELKAKDELVESFLKENLKERP